MTGMTECELIAAARRGDQDAFRELYARHLPHVRAAGRTILRTNDLDDLCQETFLLAFTRLDRFEGASNFRTWITRIAMNRCLTVLRKSRQSSNGDARLLSIEQTAGLASRQTEGEDMPQDWLFSAEDRNLQSAPDRIDMERLLRRLTPRQRKILEMAYQDETPDREIAERLGITLPAVKSRIYQARMKLRAAAGKRDGRRRRRPGGCCGPGAAGAE
jgi:RNA polymerase sigma-70 factor (ECF subfamily)